MSVFGNYARYYDLLYRDKDYVGEAKFIHQLLKTHAPQAKTILELGCGTGNHAVLLAQEGGYQLHGVDFSPEMLQTANDRKSQLPPSLAENLEFSHGDVREVRLNRSFDAVLSLFHVISYQTTNADLQAALATAKMHLKPGGILLFDVWYGPTVLSQPPAVRIKRLEDDAISVTRLAEPVLHPNENLVDVKYNVFIRDKQTNSVEELQEVHHMRYLFKPELELLLSQAGLQFIDCQEWMTDQPPGLDTWGVYFIARCGE
jgi:SAM-dependent methyltransferase